MAEQTLHSFKSNVSKIGQRLGENLAEHSRDLGLIDSFASGSGGSGGKYLENGAVVTTVGIEETKKMLASRRESERTEGLKRVIAMMIKDFPVTTFFPLVTSLLGPTTPISSRTLISRYIIHCSATAPDLALLAINAYQKDLSDPNPIVRAGAIKTLSSMGLDDIRSLVGVAISKGARDGSWYVRRATADAITTLWRKDSTYSNRVTLLPTLVILLDTASPLTIGSALSAWEEMCPTRWDLIHSGYRKWCKMLIDVEEWGQCVLLRLLVRYGRTFFLDPEKTGELDQDAELALKSSEALLQHLNPAVVSAAVKLYYYLAPSTRISKIVSPLLRLLTYAPEIEAVALEDCVIVAEQRPDLLVDHISDFFVRSTQPPSTKKARLRILVCLATQSNVKSLLSEFLIYVKDSDDSFSADAVAAIGICAQRVPAVSNECLKTLVKLVQGKNDIIISQSVLVLRSILCSPHFATTTPNPTNDIITKLVFLLESNNIKLPSARANVFWLVGRFASQGLLETVGPDTVRLGAKSFSEESDLAKSQILTLSAKILVLSQLSSSLTTHLRTLSLLFTYLTTLARYDLTYEVRSRSRFLEGLLRSAGIGGLRRGRVGLTEEEFMNGVEVEQESVSRGEYQGDGKILRVEQVREVLFAGGTGNSFAALDGGRSTPLAELGSLSLLLPSKRLIFSTPLPSYPTSVPLSSIRQSSTPEPSGSSSTVQALKGFGSDTPRGRSSTPVVLVPRAASGKTGSVSMSTNLVGGRGGLDNFYADDSESEEDEDEDEDEEAESEDEEETSEEEDEGVPRSD